MLKYLRTDKLQFRYDGIVYTWNGMYGNVCSSCESGIKHGELRAFGEHIFKAKKYTRLRTGEIVWVPIADLNIEQIRDFKQRVFKYEE